MLSGGANGRRRDRSPSAGASAGARQRRRPSRLAPQRGRRDAASRRAPDRRRRSPRRAACRQAGAAAAARQRRRNRRCRRSPGPAPSERRDAEGERLARVRHGPHLHRERAGLGTSRERATRSRTRRPRTPAGRTWHRAGARARSGAKHPESCGRAGTPLGRGSAASGIRSMKWSGWRWLMKTPARPLGSIVWASRETCPGRGRAGSRRRRRARGRPTRPIRAGRCRPGLRRATRSSST